ncbi:MAG: TolC family protein, partial [Ferruginibacter sp.]
NQYAAIALKKQRQEIVIKEIGVLRAKKLPMISVGYNNQSFTGFQKVDGVDKYFSASKRFSSVSAGLNIPLFANAANARIRATNSLLEVSKAEYADTLALQKLLLQQLILKYRKDSQTWAHYKNAVSEQAAVIYENAHLQYYNGAINFLEFSLLINEAIKLEAGYTDALHEINKTVIELNTYKSD